MAITLTTAYLAELKKNVNQPNVILEIALDSGALKWGAATANFTDVLPVVKSVSSLQNKIDTKAGYSTRGQLTVVITGRDNFKNLIANNYLKNRRMTRKDGFIAPGFAYSDYAATFTGRISDWTRKGDDLTITVSDDLIDAAKKIPVENAAKTQKVDYSNTHPVNIMTDILQTRLGIASGLIDTAKFQSERDTWLPGWAFQRVITEPKSANEYLNELQQETNSIIIHDGEKISFKVFAPPVPGDTIDEWTDNFHILSGSFSQKSGYKDGFFNRIVIYYNYDESGSDGEANFEDAVIAVDAASQGAGQWNEVVTKVIKSKWIRSYAHNQPVNVTGAVIYHVSRNNGAGTGYLTFTYAAGGSTLQWTAPGDTIGEAVKITKDGKFQVFSADKTKWARVIVETASLPVSNKNDGITLSALQGAAFATVLATKLLNRFRDPAVTASFEIDINTATSNGQFIKPTDIKDITTDEACEKGAGTWALERCMITSMKPDYAKHTAAVEVIETKFYHRYGFIAPAGLPDYPSASAAQRRYGFVGRASDNKVNAGTEEGFYVWSLPWLILLTLGGIFK